MNDRVRIDIRDGVADVRMVRTDKMNAIDDAMFDALIEAGESLKHNTEVRCAVLSGEGKAFCAGIDLNRLAKRADGALADTRQPGNTKDKLADLATRSHGIANRPQYAAWVWRELPVPVIAAVHGVAFGGGFQIMCGPDIRYVHPDTQLAIMEIRWGLIPDMAGTALFRGLVRDDVLRELTYTGRIFSGVEAREYGFATRVCTDPYEQAHITAAEIAAKSPSAIESAKRIWNADCATAAEWLMLESLEQDKLIGKPNQRETILAHKEKRAPKFVPAR